mmetsp:Transcript_107576/g.347147  ORF Transcript_107576/g.347147 Transcript_107576/m.347147 type:complete len:645 (-) Transcript_107576:86-2020(-)
MDVQWRDVCVDIGQKRILAPCSGQVLPGRMVALMGPSGSGKTTLLSCLRQDISHAGEVRFDGARFCPQMRQLVGYLEQDDVIIPQLTVRQSMRFLAELRFGVRSQQAEQRVQEVMATMRLGHVADSVVGEPGKSPRISGGERKRLCIARELLGEPRFLICDEPTSGLDSTMADQVVASLRELCDGGKVSVLSSIHQPSTNIFERFDELILLRGGEMFYNGPAAKAEAFFTSFQLQRGPTQSTAEYVMDLLVLEAAEDGPEAERPGQGLEEGKKVSLMSAETRQAVVARVASETAALPAFGPPVQPALASRRYAAPMSRQLAVLAGRHGLLLKSEVFTAVNVVQNVGLMLLAALLWVQLGFSEADVFPRYGICLWTCGTWMFFPLFGSIHIFPGVRRVLEKELRVGCYSLEAFYVARTLLLLPLDLVWPLMFTCGLYWISNINPAFVAYVQVQLLVFLCFAVFQGVGLAISAAALPPAQASTLGLLMITYFFAWSGFFIDFERVPGWLRWARLGNPFMYGVQLMAHIVFSDDMQFACDAQLVPGDATKERVGCEPSGNGTVAVLTGGGARMRHKITHDPMLCLGVLVGTLLLSRLLAFLLLRHDLRAAISGAAERPPLPKQPAEPKAVKAEGTGATPAADESHGA